MKVTVDFSDVETRSTVPEGTYDVVVESVELKESNSSEHPYLNWTLVIADGEYANSKLWTVTSFSPRALFKMQELFTSFGLTGASHELEVDESTGIVTEPELAGLAATAVVKHELYEGKPQARVVSLDGGQGGVEEAPSKTPESTGKKTGPATAGKTPARRVFK